MVRQRDYNKIAKWLLSKKFKDRHPNDLGRFLANLLLSVRIEKLYFLVEALFEIDPHLDLFTFFAHLTINDLNVKINQKDYARFMGLYKKHNDNHDFEISKDIQDFLKNTPISHLTDYLIKSASLKQIESVRGVMPESSFFDTKNYYSKIYIMGDSKNVGIFFSLVNVDDDSCDRIFEVANFKTDSTSYVNFILWFILIRKSSKNNLLDYLTSTIVSFSSGSSGKKHFSSKMNNNFFIYDWFKSEIKSRDEFTYLNSQSEITKLYLDQCYVRFFDQFNNNQLISKYNERISELLKITSLINNLSENLSEKKGSVLNWYNRTLNKNINLFIECFKLYKEIHLLKHFNSMFSQIDIIDFHPHKEISEHIDKLSVDKELDYLLHKIKHGTHRLSVDNNMYRFRDENPEKFEQVYEMMKSERSLLNYYSLIEVIYKNDLLVEATDLQKLLNSALNQDYGDLGFYHSINFPKFLVSIGAKNSPHFNRIESLTDTYYSHFLSYYFNKKENAIGELLQKEEISPFVFYDTYHYSRNSKIDIVLDLLLSKRTEKTAHMTDISKMLENFIKNILLCNNYIHNNDQRFNQFEKVLNKYGYRIEEFLPLRKSYVNLVTKPSYKKTLSLVIDQNNPKSYINLEIVKFNQELLLGVRLVDERYHNAAVGVKQIGTIPESLLEFFLDYVKDYPNIGEFFKNALNNGYESYEKYYNPFFTEMMKHKIIMDDL